MEKKRVFAFGRKNFILLAVAIVTVLLGFALMAGGGSTTESFNADIFSARRIRVAPLVCLAGYVFIICAILWQPKTKLENKEKK